MSLPNRPYASNLRHPSIGGSQASVSQSPALIARVNEKRAELENLKQLKDLSAGLATQMEALESKLSTLSDGTEAVATVLSNWHNVLRAISMASMKVPRAKAEGGGESATSKRDDEDVPLPQTLVRIPVEQNGLGKES